MKTIAYPDIVSAVKELCSRAASQLPGDVLAALKSARETETDQRAQSIITQCLDNAAIARTDDDPICQDTGFSVYFVELGSEVRVDGGTLLDAINEGTRKGYTDAYLRKSIVADPLFDRKNTGDNTPASIHIDMVTGENLSITLLPKGGGSENISALAMLKPADGVRGVVDFVTSAIVQNGGNACPPLIVGVGIGGTADGAMVLSKKALLRPVNSRHADERYAKLEQEILEKINGSGVGPQGLGGSTTALAVHIEHSPCHIASLPVAVTVNCHAARSATAVL